MANLLETIAIESTLAQRLAAMPADSKTITLDLEMDGPSLQHPAWGSLTGEAKPPSFGGMSGSGQSADGQSSNGEGTVDEGFVPIRKVVALAQLANQDPTSAEYRLVGKLGSGGTGVVYQAHQRAIDREVAVKVLRQELAQDPVSRRRFLAEARVIGSLDHPNVIALHDLCIDDTGQLFYAMKRIDGTSWDQQIGDNSVEQNLTILLRVADAIRYAHSRGLVHRDIKPENVMLGRFGEVLVADWGLAVSLSGNRDASSHAASVFSSNAIGGTPAYMAPELANGDTSAVTHQTDIYLLGAVLYEILTGHPPHNGSSLLECIRAAARNEIVPTDVEGELLDAAMKAMSTKPEDRFDSIDAFASALTDHRTHQESERLVRRAIRMAWPTEQPQSCQAKRGTAEPEGESSNEPYKRFSSCEALLREAIELWPENRRAHNTLRRMQLELARIAAAQGDLDLSLRVYQAAGEEHSEAASKVRRDLEHRDQVRASQAKYSTLFTYSPEAGMLIRWEDGVVMEANEACLEMLGYDKGDLVGRPVAELDLWACPQRRQLFVEQLGRDGRVDNFETQFVPRGVQAEQVECHESESSTTHSTARKLASNGLLDVLISSRTVNVGGEEMLLSTIRDITERRNVERNLEESRRRLRDLQRLAGLGTWSFDPESKTIRWSDETFRLTGRDPKRAAPEFEEFVSMIHPDDRDNLTHAITKALQTGASYQLRFRMLDDSGNYRDLLTRGQPVLDDTNQTIELYGILMSSF